MNFEHFFILLVCPGLTAWGVMAITFSNSPAILRRAGAAAFAAAAFAAILLPEAGVWKIVFFLAAFLPVLAWWLALRPSNERDWLPDVAILPSADISGDLATIRNIRDCEYRTEHDYTVRRYDRTFDLKDLRSMDMFLVDWGAPHMAHAMLSFGFAGDEYVCFSIETRKKKGERYSAVRGFFKQYELTYVVADERDVIRLRTDYRDHEDVYLYRLKAQPELTRQIFLDYLGGINRVKDDPEWYHAVTANCATGVWKHVFPYYPRAKFDWRILASGHADEMVYELGVVDRTLPFQELKRRSRINELSKAAGRSPEYSRLIRRGLPGF